MDPFGKAAGFVLGVIGGNWDDQEGTFDFGGAAIDTAVGGGVSTLRLRPIISDIVKKFISNEIKRSGDLPGSPDLHCDLLE